MLGPDSVVGDDNVTQVTRYDAQHDDAVINTAV